MVCKPLHIPKKTVLYGVCMGSQVMMWLPQGNNGGVHTFYHIEQSGSHSSCLDRIPSTLLSFCLFALLACVRKINLISNKDRSCSASIIQLFGPAIVLGDKYGCNWSRLTLIALFGPPRPNEDNLFSPPCFLSPILL